MNYKKIIMMSIITLVVILFNVKPNYAIISRYNNYYDSIEGSAMEKIGDLPDEELPKIKNIVVNLLNQNDEIIATTLTDENGKYRFDNLPEGKYTVQFKWGELDDNKINNINNQYDIKEIKDILKYNAQDYMPEYYEVEGTKEVVQIYLVLDRSGSMSGERINKAKELATGIVRSLLNDNSLGDQIDVKIGLVTFESSANRNSGLTDNAETLTSSISGIGSGGGTDIVSGLQLAYDDQEFNKDNRFIFLLSDGEDNQGMDRVHNYINTLLEEEIYIYSLYIGNNTDSVRQYYDNTEFKDTNIVGNDNIINELIDEFIEYLQVSIGYEEVIEDEERRNIVNEFFKEFNYENTVIFKALEMNVTTRNELNNFKNYANSLSNETYMTGKSSKVCRITTPRNAESTAVTFSGPNLRLKRRPVFSIKSNMTVTEMSLVASNGTVISNMTTNIEEQKHLLSTIDTKMLYGANVSLQYAIDFTNVSTVCNECDNITLICYIPDGFLYSNKTPLTATGINTNNETVPLQVSDVIAINSKNVDNLINRGIVMAPEVRNYIKSNHTALIARVYTKSNGFQLAQNEKARINLVVNKLLASDENTTYDGKVEILNYSNEFFRRIQYQATGTQANLGTSELTGAIAGNFDEDEGDYVVTSNLGVIIPPTGKDKRMYKIYIAIAVLLIMMLIVIKEVIKIHKNKKKENDDE